MDKNKEYDRCLRCGRKLKTPENRKIGYGPVCFKKSQKKRLKSLFTTKVFVD